MRFKVDLSPEDVKKVLLDGARRLSPPGLVPEEVVMQVTPQSDYRGDPCGYTVTAVVFFKPTDRSADDGRGGYT